MSKKTMPRNPMSVEQSAEKVIGWLAQAPAGYRYREGNESMSAAQTIAA